MTDKEMPDEIWAYVDTYKGEQVCSYYEDDQEDHAPRGTSYTRTDLVDELKAENENLKRLAYHKEGVSYQSLFTASIGMADEAEELKAENEQQAAEIERLRKWERCAAGMRIHLAHDRHQVAKEVYDAVKHDEVKEE